MFCWQLLIYLTFLYSINAKFQVNMHYTDDSNQIYNLTQTNWLRLLARKNSGTMLKKLPFCLSDLPLTLKQKGNFFKIGRAHV